MVVDLGKEDEDEDDYGRQEVFRDGKVHVLKQMCATCVFRPGNLMKLAPGRVDGMVADCLANDSTITCHDTLGTSEPAICRGFYSRYWHRNWLLRLARAQNMIKGI